LFIFNKIEVFPFASVCRVSASIFASVFSPIYMPWEGHLSTGKANCKGVLRVVAHPSTDEFLNLSRDGGEFRYLRTFR
jgi:hypothetical protein